MYPATNALQKRAACRHCNRTQQPCQRLCGVLEGAWLALSSWRICTNSTWAKCASSCVIPDAMLRTARPAAIVRHVSGTMHPSIVGCSQRGQAAERVVTGWTVATSFFRRGTFTGEWKEHPSRSSSSRATLVPLTAALWVCAQSRTCAVQGGDNGVARRQTRRVVLRAGHLRPSPLLSQQVRRPRPELLYEWCGDRSSGRVITTARHDEL